MREWLTTANLAGLALPGMPATRQGWDALAEREGWSARKDRVRLGDGRGGGLEYHVTLLPAAALADLAARSIGAVEIPRGLPAPVPGEAPCALSPRGLEGRDARLWILAAADRYASAAGLTRRLGDAAFAALYNLKRFPVDAWVRDAVPELAPRTLRRWRADVSAGQSGRLGVDRGAARRGRGALDMAEGGEVKRAILALIAHQPHVTADHVQKYCARKFPSFSMPPVRTFQHYLKGLKTTEAVLLAKVTNPDGFKSAYRLSGRGSHPTSRLNELWMIDASPVDALCVDGRWTVYVCVDIYSRRLIVFVTRTPRASAVALLIRAAILRWGVPEVIFTDNGSDFVAKSIKRLFASLRIEVEQARPFSPEEKGHVERAIGTLQRDLMPLLPGFIGHSVKDRKVIEERRAFAQRLGEDDARAFKVELTARELQRYCGEWAEGRYLHRPHEGLGRATPFEMAASYAGTVRRIEDVRALDLLLAPIAGSDGLRTVTKTGLRIDNSHYIFAAALPGAQVFCRMDPFDMGRAYVFEPDGETYLGEAICPELAGVDPAKAVAMARAAQKTLLDEGTRKLRADMRRIKPRDLVEAVVSARFAETRNIVEFPKTIEGYSTPALEAARDAIAAPEMLALPPPPTAAVPSPSPLLPETGVVRMPETRQQRFRRARGLEAEVAAGVAIASADALWLGGYQAGPEYRAMRDLYDDFGEEALG